MRFRLTPKSMTLIDLVYFKFSQNFAGFHRFGSQQRLNK